jgi:hypothetical protein
MLTNEEMVDSLIIDLNSLPKYLIDGQFIAACDLVAKMGQKLANLKTGIHNDIESRDKTIDSLKKTLHDNGIKMVDVPAENLIFEEEDGAKHE